MRKLSILLVALFLSFSTVPMVIGTTLLAFFFVLVHHNVAAAMLVYLAFSGLVLRFLRVSHE